MSNMKDLMYVMETENVNTIARLVTGEEMGYADNDTIKDDEYSIYIERSGFTGAFVIRFSKNTGNFTLKENTLIKETLKAHNRECVFLKDNCVFVDLGQSQDIKPYLNNDYTPGQTYKTMVYARMLAYSLFYSIDKMSIERPHPITYWADPVPYRPH